MRRLTIDDLAPWLEVRFDPSSGPGGQNVNKLSTRATLLLDFRACSCLNDDEKERIARRLARRLARDGRVRIVAQQARTQSANRSRAETRLIELLQEAVHVPRTRRATRPTRAAVAQRLRTKRRHGERKRERRSRGERDE